MPLLRFLLLLPFYGLKFIGTLFKTMMVLLGKIASPLIGNIRWEAPEWFSHVSPLFHYAVNFIKKYPLRIATLIIFLSLAFLGGQYGYHWYQNRPGAIDIAPTTYQEANIRIVKTPSPTNFRDKNPVFDHLIIDFGTQAAPLEALSTSVTEGIKLSPELDGTWKWNPNGTQLIFTPKKDWIMAQKYTISLNPTKLLAATIKTETKSLEFYTEDIKMTLSDKEFYQDPMSPLQKKSIFHVKFNYPIDIASFEKAVTLKITTKKDKLLSTPQFYVTYNDSKMDAWIHSEPLTLPEDLSQMKLHIQKGVSSSKPHSGKAEEVFSAMDIPGLYTLKITQVNTSVVKNANDKYEHALVVNTNDAVKGMDLLYAATLWLLPEKNPDYPSIENYKWNTSAVTEKILSESKALTFQIADTQNEYEKTQSLIFNAPPNRYIFAQFKKGLHSVGGYQTGNTTASTLRVTDYPSTLQFMSKGSILSLNGEQKVSIAAQNVSGMKLDVKRVSPAELHHLVAFSYVSDFAHTRFNAVNENNFIERFTHKQPIKTLTPEEISYESIDLKPYFLKEEQGKRGVFLLQLMPWDTNKDQPIQYNAASQNTRDDRLIVVTDIGIIVKHAEDSSSDVFVQSISHGQPVENAKISVVGKNGKAVLSGFSDATGHIHFKPLNDFTNEKEPLMYLVEKGDDLSFLPIKEHAAAGKERSLNLSRFDIGGVKNGQEGELKAYLFSDRSVYKPGDTFHIGSILKTNKWDMPMKGMPLIAEIYDSRNMLIQSKSLTVDESGLNELSYTTQENVPTGEWNIYLYSINKNNHRTPLGSTTIHIKEFEPDRLNVSIKIDPKSTKHWLTPEELNATVSVQNLFGTPAQKLRVATTLTLTPASPSFEPFKGYSFYEDHSKTQTFTTKLEDAFTNQEGIATLKLGLTNYAPASYYVQLLSEAFEAESGRSVVSMSKTLVSPYPFFIGTKADGDMSYIKKDTVRKLHMIAVDPTMKQIGISNLKLELIENTYISVLTKQSSGVYKYESKLKEVPIGEQKIDISDQGYYYTLPTDKPGNYLLLLKNETGNILYKTSFAIAGNANVTRSLNRDAELKLTLSKKEYQPGENIDISINAPYVGSGLITIERDKVYAWKWFKTTTTNSTQSIQLPKDLDGNAYVNVQFIRDPNSNEIFMSPLSYGVAPFNINVSKHHLDLSLESPKVVKPGTTLPIKIQTNEKQKVIVFAVDEGILQVARYDFQDPLKFFFRKKELSVDSLQILDLILPEFSKLKESSAPGGDMTAFRSMHLNPFKRKSNKAVAFWSGIVEVDGEKILHYTVPDYFNGKLRVMAVAVTPQGIGAAQTNTLVRGDFVLSPNAPFVVAPGDEFEVSLSVANNRDTHESSTPISIVATSSKHLNILENASQTLTIPEKSEGVVRFKMKASNILGNADITFVATNGSTSITRKESISVRPAVPFRTHVTIGQMHQAEETVGALRHMYDEYAKRTVTLAHSPSVLMNGLSSYLENYPYTCSEQLVSRAIPALFLDSRPELSTQNGDTIRQRIDTTLEVLRTRQNSRGGFGLWRATVQSDPFVTAYVTQFLIEAYEKGKTIPNDMLKNANSYLQNVASDETNNDEYGLRLRAFAVYLLTRQNKVTTNLLSTVQSRLQNRFGDEWKNGLSALYLAASYKMLKMDKEANELLQGPWKSLSRAYSDAWWEGNYNDPLIQNATFLYVIVKHFPELASDIPTKALENMVLMLRQERYTSLSSAMSILAIEAYSTALLKKEKTDHLSISALDKENKTRLISTLKGLLVEGNFSDQDVKITLHNPNDIPAWYSVTQEGFDQIPDVKGYKNGLEIIRTYTDLDGKKINQVTLGEKINVHILVRSISSEHINNLAIIDLIPGGFEIVQQTSPTENKTDDDIWTSPAQLQGSSWNPVFTDTREDRMIIFGEATQTAQEFVYQIKANSVGTFIIPSAFGEAMYDRAVHALSPGEGTIHVIAPQTK